MLASRVAALALALASAAEPVGTRYTKEPCDGTDDRVCVRRVDLGSILVFDDIDPTFKDATTLVLVEKAKDKELVEALKTALSAGETASEYWYQTGQSGAWDRADRAQRLKRGQELEKARKAGVPPPPPDLPNMLPDPAELRSTPDTMVYTLEEWAAVLAEQDRRRERKSKLVQDLASDETGRLSTPERVHSRSRNQGEGLKQFIDETRVTDARALIDEYRADMKGRVAVVMRHRPPTRPAPAPPAPVTPPAPPMPASAPDKPAAWAPPCASTSPARGMPWLIERITKEGGDANVLFGPARRQPSRQLTVPGNLTADGVTYSADVALAASGKPTSLALYALPTFDRKPEDLVWSIATDLRGRPREFSARHVETNAKARVSAATAGVELDKILAVFCAAR